MTASCCSASVGVQRTYSQNFEIKLAKCSWTFVFLCTRTALPCVRFSILNCSPAWPFPVRPPISCTIMRGPPNSLKNLQPRGCGFANIPKIWLFCFGFQIQILHEELKLSSMKHSKTFIWFGTKRWLESRSDLPVIFSDRCEVLQRFEINLRPDGTTSGKLWLGCNQTS